MNIKNSIKETIGSTPLVRAVKTNDTRADILLKVESFNPSGSVKDRAALFMLEDAKKRGLIKEGGTIIEPTSGNTGIGLAMLAAADGFKAVFVMPDTMSVERIKLFKAYGAEVVLTPGEKGMRGALEKADELHKQIPGSFIPGQFSNPENARAHVQTTALEIWRDTDASIDFFVAGVGTGGTLSGAGSELKRLNPNVKVIAVEPADSPLLSKGTAAPHKLQGIGANFVPELYDKTVVDEIITVTTQEAGENARALAQKEGIFCGISSGAAMAAARKIGARAENAGKTIVVVLPDSGSRYLSTWLCEE